MKVLVLLFSLSTLAEEFTVTQFDGMNKFQRINLNEKRLINLQKKVLELEKRVKELEDKSKNSLKVKEKSAQDY